MTRRSSPSSRLLSWQPEIDVGTHTHTHAHTHTHTHAHAHDRVDSARVGGCSCSFVSLCLFVFLCSFVLCVFPVLFVCVSSVSPRAPQGIPRASPRAPQGSPRDPWAPWFPTTFGSHPRVRAVVVVLSVSVLGLCLLSCLSLCLCLFPLILAHPVLHFLSSFSCLFPRHHFFVQFSVRCCVMNCKYLTQIWAEVWRIWMKMLVRMVYF